MKKVFLILISILLLSFVSAHQNCQDLDSKKILFYEKFDNSNRYPIGTYKYGYTYRATDEFKEKYNNKKFHEIKYKNWNKDYYYKWSSHLREYEKIECYHAAPTRKLFYRKCI